MRRERESPETQTPHCPMCDKPLEGINDYPKIVIQDVVVFQTPKFVRELSDHPEIKAKVRELSKSPELRLFLERLSKNKNLIKPSDINFYLTESGNPDDKGFFKLEGRYYLNVSDTKTPNTASVGIYEHRVSRMGWGFLEDAKLAEIHYEGVLNEPPEDLLRGMLGAGRAGY